MTMAMSMRLSLCLSVCLSVCLFACLPACLSVFDKSLIKSRVYKISVKENPNALTHWSLPLSPSVCLMSTVREHLTHCLLCPLSAVRTLPSVPFSVRFPGDTRDAFASVFWKSVCSFQICLRFSIFHQINQHILSNQISLWRLMKQRTVFKYPLLN